MGFRRGIQANNPNNAISSEAGIKQLPQILSKIKDGIQNGRVTDIVLNSDHPKFKTYGSYNGLGTIEFELVNFLSGTTLSAKPFFPNTSTWPLVNELVLIFKLPYKGIGKNTSEEGYFYINMIGLWNHPHINAYPNPITNTDLPPEQQKDYQQVEAGSTRKIATSQGEENIIDLSFNSPTNPSQDTFIERSKLHPLLNFAGDVIYQGRWGNSLRFGSTVKTDSVDNNTWSETGENGDPITILRNGQDPNSSSEGWIPITEDVNNDLASIWFTSTQKIPLTTSNNNYTSYQSEPTKPDQYTSPQVIINSDRLVFNAKTDNILMSAQESIFLGSNSSINFTTPQHIIESRDIKLGGKDASEAAILGDTFLDNLNEVMDSLDFLATTLQSSTIWPGGASAPNAPQVIAANELSTSVLNFKSRLASYKSKTSKIK